MSIKANSNANYLTCNVAFNEVGVVLEFEPKTLPNKKIQHHTEQQYEAVVAPLRLPGAGAAGSAIPELPNGTFNRKEHMRLVANDRPTKIAFLVDPLSSWRFTDKGFALKTVGAQGKFLPISVAPSRKVVEVTFTPAGQGEEKEYAYELWLQADVVNAQGVASLDGSSVTIIVDPIIKDTTIPP